MILYIKEILSVSLDVFLDSAPFMLAVFFMAGLLKIFVPDDWVSRHLNGKGATASTPIAAAIIAKGISPGTELVFLLSGPATTRLL